MTLQIDFEESSSILARTIDALGWSSIDQKAPELTCCPFNENHWVPKNRLEQHTQYCTLRRQGYLKQEIEAMIPEPELAQTNLTQQSCIDWTSDPQWNMNLEAFEVNKRNRIRLMQANSADSSESTKSKLEALALMRDLKRRRQSYRGIHTAKKSYTEVLRELIAHQTELLLQSVRPETNLEDCKSGLTGDPKPNQQTNLPRPRLDDDPNASRQSNHRTDRDQTDCPYSNESTKRAYSPDQTRSRKSRHHNRRNSSSPESRHSKKAKKHKHKHKHHKHK